MSHLRPEITTTAEAAALRKLARAMDHVSDVLNTPGGSLSLLEERDRLHDAVAWMLGVDRCPPGEVLLRSALALPGHGARMSPPDTQQIPRVANLLARMPWTMEGLARLAACNDGWREAMGPICRAARLEPPNV